MRLAHFVRSFAVAFLVTCSGSLNLLAQAKAPGPVYVIFWFDTEDYLLPASDDAAKRLAELLTSKGVRATFKVVGEKARVLEKRGRTDVITALKKHDIGFHANFHSVHPTPSEYLADAGFLDGIAEFARREGPGAADVRRIFGVPTLACYGQPGSSWGAQAIAALDGIGVAPHGVPCYVDEGTHIGVNEQPFWYENALVVYHMGQNYTRMELHDDAGVEPGKQTVSKIAERLRADGGGLISIFYHPCEWVHKQFWDGVNFSRGANPPREEWKAPPQRTPEETDAAFKRFAQYVDHIKTIPGIHFATASDLPTIYADDVRNSEISGKALMGLCNGVSQEGGTLNYIRTSNGYWSLADQFEGLTHAAAKLIGGETNGAFQLGSKAIPDVKVRVSGIFGPEERETAGDHSKAVPWSAFQQTIRDVENYIETQHRVPSRVFIGADHISPADYLVGLADALFKRMDDGHFPETVKLGRAVSIDPENNVARDTPDLFGGWIIHKQGFRAPKILEIARLQAWTLKPAALGAQTKVHDQ